MPLRLLSLFLGGVVALKIVGLPIALAYFFGFRFSLVSSPVAVAILSVAAAAYLVATLLIAEKIEQSAETRR